MTSAKTHEPSYIKAKRHFSIAFLLLETPVTVPSVKQALLVTLRKDQSSLPKHDSVRDFDGMTLKPDDIEIGIQVPSSKKAGDSSPEYTLLADDDPVTEKTVVWRLIGEDFKVELYPDNDNED